MKKILIAVTILAVPALFATSAAHAQQPISTTAVAERTSVSDAEIELMRKDLRSKRKQVIAANIQLTEEELQEIDALLPPGLAAGTRYPEAGMRAVNR